MLTLRTAEVDMVKNDEALEINLDLLEEKREDATIQEAKSKAKMEKYYNVRGRNTSFKPGNLIYRNNKASHAEDGGKLRPKWEAPYEVTKALGKGSYKLRDRNGEHPAANLKRLEVANSSSSKVTVGGSASFGSVSTTWSLKIERGGTTPEDVKVIERVVMGLVVTGVAEDAMIAHLRSLLSLKETEAAKAIHLCSQLSIVEAVDAAKSTKLRDLKERNFALEGEKDALFEKVATFESMNALKETELASLTDQIAQLTSDLSCFQLSRDELSSKVAFLESERDRLANQL
nr:reverse transcriptase domain-containing protein [Tanacetum cinerariifolium]